MYKDKAKQRESDRERAKAYRMRKRGVTPSHPDITPVVTPSRLPEIPHVIRPPGARNLPVVMEKDIANLPQGIKDSIERVHHSREILGLFDDREERYRTAALYRLVYMR